MEVCQYGKTEIKKHCIRRHFDEYSAYRLLVKKPLMYIRKSGYTAQIQFVDWSSKGTPYALAGMCAVLAMALEAGEALCGWLEQPAHAQKCRSARKRLRLNGEYSGNRQATGLVALSGLEDAVAVNERHLRADPANGLSTFLGYYVLLARAKAGDITGALDVIRRYWGGMLAMGASTFWEDFDMQWASACPIDRLPQEGEADVHRDFGRIAKAGNTGNCTRQCSFSMSSNR